MPSGISVVPMLRASVSVAGAESRQYTLPWATAADGYAGQQAGNVRNDQADPTNYACIATVLAVMSVAQTINPKRRRSRSVPANGLRRRKA